MALSVDFTIQGSNRVRNQLRTIAAFHPELTDPVIGKHAKKESKRMRKEPYPSYLPHFTHTRTYELRRKFRAQHVKSGVWRVINRAAHAPWVIKKGFQKDHPSFLRWWTMQDKLQENIPTLTKQLSVMLERELERQ